VYSMPPKQKLEDALAGKKFRQGLEEKFGVTLTSSSESEPEPPGEPIANYVVRDADSVLRSWIKERTKRGAVRD
ncbi:hypothetical protein, partial [Klebsiella pneumoniae]|uniref:hypothetical protein n=1 Tax=Klebsiella pneumoniae TaxID=573 RepID=UPI002553C66D